MTSRTWFGTLALAAALALAPARLSAQPLPAFGLTGPDGQPASSASLDRAGRWLLVYVFPGSAPSDRLVQWIGESWPADRLDRLVLIVAADPARARAYLADKGSAAVAGAAWYADPDGGAWSALRFEGTLAVVGMADGSADWKLDGVIQDPLAVTRPIGAWLGLAQGGRP